MTYSKIIHFAFLFSLVLKKSNIKLCLVLIIKNSKCCENVEMWKPHFNKTWNGLCKVQLIFSFQSFCPTWFCTDGSVCWKGSGHFILGHCLWLQQRFDDVITVGQGVSQHLHGVLANQRRGRRLIGGEAAETNRWTWTQKNKKTGAEPELRWDFLSSSE